MIREGSVVTVSKMLLSWLSTHTHTHTHSNYTVLFIRFHHSCPTNSDYTHTRAPKHPLPRIPSSELHGNHSLTPITMATGISITHAFFTDQFPLCVWCVCPCISLFVSPAPWFSTDTCFFQGGHQPKAINLLIQSLSRTGRCVTAVSRWLLCGLRCICCARCNRQSALEQQT